MIFPSSHQRSRRERIVRRLVFVIAAIFLVRSVGRDFAQIKGLEPTFGWLLPAFALAAIGWLASGFGWLVLFGRDAPRKKLLDAYAVGQLGKYAPGSVMQAVGQVGLAFRAGLAAPEVAVAFAISMATSIEGGLVVGSAWLAFEPTADWLIWLPSSAVLGLVVLSPRFITAAMRLIPMRVRPVSSGVTRYRSTLASVCWAVVSLTASGLAFVAIGASLGTDLPLRAVPGYAVAWVVGVLAIPFPAGIGVREAVLGRVLPATPVAVVIGISLLHRLVTIVAEVILAMAWRLVLLRREV